MMDEMIKYLPLLIPVILVHCILAITALVHIFKHDHYKFGNRVVWCLVVILIQIIGSIAYFLFGRDDRE